MGEPGFWDNKEQSRETSTRLSQIKREIEKVVDFQSRVEDLEIMCDLVAETNGKDSEGLEEDISKSVNELRKELTVLELKSFLNGPHDKSNAILSIHAGAGGTESCDWADMLLRMYLRWAERREYFVEIQDIQPGDETGISSATISLKGDNAYGYAKAERGVHRLVRISPFDSNNRRHTSFSAVDVIAELENDVDIAIDESDLRVDTYRSSGKGGQHVNKTDSAVRLTHLPTGIVVACQNERSQFKNKATAMTVLRSRIYEKIEDDKRAKMERFYGAKNEIGWGNQIRSYVFQPYQMVKDLRVGVDSPNVQAVMDGDIDHFIDAWLRAGCPSTRRKD